MNQFQVFLLANKLQKQEIAEYLGISKTWTTQLWKGEKSLSDKLLYKIRNNSKNWDVSMFDTADPNAVNSVINSHDFQYDQSVNADLVAIIREQQAQMGVLINSISILTNKISK